jgi:recombination protein RecT
MTVIPMTDREPGADIEQRSPAGTLISKIQRDEAIRTQIAMALPQTVSLDRFARATSTALLQNPDLAKSDEAALFQAVVKCAQDGLLPDGREAALVLYKGKAQYLPMIGGVRKIAAEYGWTIRTHVVYANDEFAVEQGTNDRILHRPVPIGADRGPLVAAYAVAHHRDGRRSFFEVMTGEDIAKAKAVAQTDRVWKQWPSQMWEKTVGHRIAKKLPLDPIDSQRLTRVLNAVDLGPAESAAALYGPDAGASFSELPSGVQPDEPPAEQVTDTASVQGAAGDTPAAAGDTPSPDAPPAAAPPIDEAAIEAAATAAEYVPPSGRYAEGGEEGPLDLAGILDLGDPGRKFLDTCLNKLSNPEWRAATEAFCRVNMPDEYARWLATSQQKAA